MCLQVLLKPSQYFVVAPFGLNYSHPDLICLHPMYTNTTSTPTISEDCPSCNISSTNRFTKSG